MVRPCQQKHTKCTMKSTNGSNKLDKMLRNVAKVSFCEEKFVKNVWKMCNKTSKNVA